MTPAKTLEDGRHWNGLAYVHNAPVDGCDCGSCVGWFAPLPKFKIGQRVAAIALPNGFPDQRPRIEDLMVTGIRRVNATKRPDGMQDMEAYYRVTARGLLKPIQIEGAERFFEAASLSPSDRAGHPALCPSQRVQRATGPQGEVKKMANLRVWVTALVPTKGADVYHGIRVSVATSEADAIFAAHRHYIFSNVATGRTIEIKSIQRVRTADGLTFLQVRQNELRAAAMATTEVANG